MQLTAHVGTPKAHYEVGALRFAMPSRMRPIGGGRVMRWLWEPEPAVGVGDGGGGGSVRGGKGSGRGVRGEG